MKILLMLFLLFPFVAFAENYSLSASWTDPTVPGPGYSAVYDAEYRIASGAEVLVNDLSTPNFSSSIAATPGDLIEVRVRAENVYDPGNVISGNWSTWFSAIAPLIPTSPADQTGVVITISPQ